MAEDNTHPFEEQQQPTLPAPSTPMKTYNMYYTTSRTNVTLHLNSTKDSPPLYYVSSTIITTKPTLHLHSGSSKTSPIVASARLHYTSRHILLSHNSNSSFPSPETETVWEELRRGKTRFVRSDYEFETAIGAHKGERRAYRWRVAKSIVKTVYKCVDEEGRNVANMYSGGCMNWRKGGEIEIMEGMETGLEEMLIMSALAIWAAEAAARWSVFQGYGKGGGEGGKEGKVVS